MLGEYLGSILLFVATFLAVYIFYRSRNNRKYSPSLPWLPVVGSLPFLGSLDKLPQTMMKKAATIGNVFAFYAGYKYIVVLNGREAIHEALVKKAVIFSDRDLYYGFEKNPLRDKSLGVAMRQYDDEFKHIQHQTLSILKDFGFGKRIMENRIITEVEQLIQLGKDKKGEAFDCHEILASCVMNVIYSILFGQRQEPFGARISEVIRTSNDTMKSVVPEVHYIPLLKYLPSYKTKILNHFVYMQKYEAALAKCIDEALKMESDNDSFVRSFVNGGSDRSELIGVIRDLILAGSDTSTTTLKWSVILLANHPEVQERLHQEKDSVVPRDRLPNLDDKTKLPYMEASIMEVMRCKTLTPVTIPHRTQGDTEVGGYFIPKGTPVIPNLYSAHMDPRKWNQPTVFRPERFLDDGKRSCLGEPLARQELFLFFAGLVQQFEIRPPVGEDTIAYEQKLKTTFSPTPFKVRLIPRQL